MCIRDSSNGVLVGIIVSFSIQILFGYLEVIHLILFSATGVISCFIFGYLASLLFEKIYKYEEGAPSRIIPNAPNLELEAYFLEIFDTYDESRVYASDIKKIIQWYNILVTQNWKPNSNAASDKKEKSASKKENLKTNKI